MTNLHSLVQAYVAPPGRLGGPTEPSFAGQSVNQATLRSELARLRRSREIAFWICFGALILVFALSVMFLVQNAGSPGAIQKMSAATGVTTLGLVGLMTKLWQDKVKADLVLAIVMGMSEENLKDALRQLLERL